ncbi:unnamed protein product, partial [Laminaria digitata]
VLPLARVLRRNLSAYVKYPPPDCLTAPSPEGGSVESSVLAPLYQVPSFWRPAASWPCVGSAECNNKIPLLRTRYQVNSYILKYSIAQSRQPCAAGKLKFTCPRIQINNPPHPANHVFK